MSQLDINTPRGQQTAADEKRAVEIFEANYQGYKYLHTNKKTMSKADAFLYRGDSLAGMVLTSCRYNCCLLTFQSNWNWEWLVTYRKLAIGAFLSKHLQTHLVGFLYIVQDDLLLIQKLYDYEKSKWVPPIRFDYTETQATCNGGTVVRKNAFIKIDNAVQVKRK